MVVATESIRNVVLLGHNGNGKTSLVEAMLYRAGVVSRMGVVDSGSTVSDSDPVEKERQQSLSLSTVSFDWNGHKINIIDPPGYPDYRGDALLGMHVAELALFVIDAVSGPQAQDIVLWQRAEKLNLPRMLFVNKLDRPNASFDRTLVQIREHFGMHADPVELPIGEESEFHGFTDLLTHHSFVYDSGKAEEIPNAEAVSEAERAQHEHLIEEVVEIDDEILEQYLEGTEPTPEQLERLLHEAVDRALVFPVLCGSATVPIGTDHLLDFICAVGPAPGDLGPTEVLAGENIVEISHDATGNQLAFVFKTKVDDFLGQLSLMKVISGTIKADDQLRNTRTHDSLRLHQLFSPMGGEYKPISEIVAGDIAAVAKLDGTLTGDTFAPPGMPVTVEPPQLPAPVCSIAVKAQTPAQENRLITALRRQIVEDPTLSLTHEEGQTVLSGSGETHLHVALSRVSQSGVEVETELTKVAYRETLARSIEVEGKFKKQSGGHGQFGIAMVRFEPLPPGSGYEFASEVTGGAIPRNLIPAVGQGIEEAMARGGKYGYPVVDLRAVCLNGKHHAVDSSEMSFKIAGSLALRAALDKVGVTVLEPISEIWVHVLNQHQGDVLGDLSSRRAHVQGTGSGDTNQGVSIHAHVPTSEIQRYAIDLRSMTGGTGRFEASHIGYQPVPGNIVGQLVSADAE